MKTKEQRPSRRIWRALIAFVCVILAALGWFWFDNNVDRSGWVEKEGIHYYRDFHGRRVTGWQDIQGSRYYFNEEYALQTGWQEIGGDRYYLGTDGAMETLWLDLDSQRYYLGEDGVLRTGWQDIDGQRYYFDADGVMTTGWAVRQDGTYHFGEDGAMTTGWFQEEDCRYWFGQDGQMTTGKVTIDDIQYCFTDEGIMYTGWEDTDEGRSYYLDSGAMVVGWTDIDGKRYYFDEAGLMYTGWLTEGEYSYYLQEDGSAAVGPLVIDGATHYFTPKGIHVVLVNASNYVPDYYEVNLVTVTGWHQVSDVCLEPLKQMLADCVAAGNQYTFNSAYRTIAEQAQILELRTQEHMEDYDLDYNAARAKALQTVAIPGTSEHHLGLAVDILGDGAIAWLTEHCWEYGFIARYTGEKYGITGIIAEPWHFRYVGTEVSMDMKDSGLCLEEYLGAVPVTSAESDSETED